MKESGSGGAAPSRQIVQQTVPGVREVVLSACGEPRRERHLLLRIDRVLGRCPATQLLEIAAERDVTDAPLIRDTLLSRAADACGPDLIASVAQRSLSVPALCAAARCVVRWTELLECEKKDRTAENYSKFVRRAKSLVLAYLADRSNDALTHSALALLLALVSNVPTNVLGSIGPEVGDAVLGLLDHNNPDISGLASTCAAWLPQNSREWLQSSRQLLQELEAVVLELKGVDVGEPARTESLSRKFVLVGTVLSSMLEVPRQFPTQIPLVPLVALVETALESAAVRPSAHLLFAALVRSYTTASLAPLLPRLHRALRNAVDGRELLLGGHDEELFQASIALVDTFGVAVGEELGNALAAAATASVGTHIDVLVRSRGQNEGVLASARNGVGGRAALRAAQLLSRLTCLCWPYIDQDRNAAEVYRLYRLASEAEGCSPELLSELRCACVKSVLTPRHDLRLPTTFPGVVHDIRSTQPGRLAFMLESLAVEAITHPRGLPLHPAAVNSWREPLIAADSAMELVKEQDGAEQARKTPPAQIAPQVDAAREKKRPRTEEAPGSPSEKQADEPARDLKSVGPTVRPAAADGPMKQDARQAKSEIDAGRRLDAGGGRHEHTGESRAAPGDSGTGRMDVALAQKSPQGTTESDMRVQRYEAAPTRGAALDTARPPDRVEAAGMAAPDDGGAREREREEESVEQIVARVDFDAGPDEDSS